MIKFYISLDITFRALFQNKISLKYYYLKKKIDFIIVFLLFVKFKHHTSFQHFVFSGIRVTQSLAFYVVFYVSSFFGRFVFFLLSTVLSIYLINTTSKYPFLY